MTGTAQEATVTAGGVRRPTRVSGLDVVVMTFPSPDDWAHDCEPAPRNHDELEAHVFVRSYNQAVGGVSIRFVIASN
ncbi:hypothetical protein GCM10017600_84200 [Streptosporangium carneum]|uniref:Uncharacterized protein n=1 Tax=Streptosporangium carneum TaxID=47481 RepID=A0A9W6IAW7_9ACTN|nr:hypothetical protein GCM10017600_84200 [Streptosporangium carneum]